MKHLDLFSGIGGFALAVDTVWPGSEHIFCEIDPFCQSVLRKHWKNAKIYSDIRELTYQKWLEDVQGVEQQKTFQNQRSKIAGTEVIADLVKKLNMQSGEQPIKNNTEQEQKLGFKIDADKLLSIMEQFASAVEKQTTLSYPLTIKIMTDILSENSIPTGLYSQELLKTIIQIATKFFVITATTQKLIWDNALIGPNSKIYGDIRQITANSKSGESREPTKQKGWEDIGGSGCDLLTGGFPCQPFSQAGQRKGTEDDRHLWPEMFRVIREFHPRWIIGENVGGFVTWSEGLVLEQVHTDLESEGYEVQSFIIPAVSVNAPHRRDRVWIVAHKRSERPYNSPNEQIVESKRGSKLRPKQPRNYGRKEWNQNWLEVATRLCRVDDGLPARLYFLGGLEYNGVYDPKRKSQNKEAIPTLTESIWTEMRRMWEYREAQQTPHKNGSQGIHNPLHQMPHESPQDTWFRELGATEKEKELCDMWKDFYSSPFNEAQNLFPKMLERIREIERTKKVGQKYGFELTKSRHRVERLKSLGNAIVPQVAMEIMRTIKN